MSSYFEWDPAKFSIQVPAMDDDHREIIACMNRLHELHDAKASAAALGKALGELVRVTREHFADEEAYMEGLEFPERRTHGIIHKQLLERLTQFKSAFDSSGKLTDDLFVFLRMWLKSHICGIDTKYAAFSRAA